MQLHQTQRHCGHLCLSWMPLAVLHISTTSNSSAHHKSSSELTHQLAFARCLVPPSSTTLHVLQQQLVHALTGVLPAVYLPRCWSGLHAACTIT
jgi:hypothetical protein